MIYDIGLHRFRNYNLRVLLQNLISCTTLLYNLQIYVLNQAKYKNIQFFNIDKKTKQKFGKNMGF